MIRGFGHAQWAAVLGSSIVDRREQRRQEPPVDPGAVVRPAPSTTAPRARVGRDRPAPTGLQRRRNPHAHRLVTSGVSADGCRLLRCPRRAEERGREHSSAACRSRAARARSAPNRRSRATPSHARFQGVQSPCHDPTVSGRSPARSAMHRAPAAHAPPRPWSEMARPVGGPATRARIRSQRAGRWSWSVELGDLLRRLEGSRRCRADGAEPASAAEPPPRARGRSICPRTTARAHARRRAPDRVTARSAVTSPRTRSRVNSLQPTFTNATGSLLGKHLERGLAAGARGPTLQRTSGPRARGSCRVPPAARLQRRCRSPRAGDLGPRSGPHPGRSPRRVRRGGARVTGGRRACRRGAFLLGRPPGEPSDQESGLDAPPTSANRSEPSGSNPGPDDHDARVRAPQQPGQPTRSDETRGCSTGRADLRSSGPIRSGCRRGASRASGCPPRNRSSSSRPRRRCHGGSGWKLYRSSRGGSHRGSPRKAKRRPRTSSGFRSKSSFIRTRT